MIYEKIEIDSSIYFIDEDGTIYVQLDSPSELVWYANSIADVEKE
jgi:histidinol phosphatase-like enzyme